MSDVGEQQIRDAEERRHTAMRCNDTASLGELLADDLVYVHSSGMVDSKDSYLRLLADGTLEYLYIDHAEASVNVGDCFGMVVGRLTARVKESSPGGRSAALRLHGAARVPANLAYT